MASRFDGKVAFVTGAARGQGRSHIEQLAAEGADIIGVDVCGPISSVTTYEAATSADLAAVVAAVEAEDRRMVAVEADVRDQDALTAAVERGVAELGKGIDIVVSNAGIWSFAPLADLTEEMWTEMIDVTLGGSWHTVKATLPHLNDGASIVFIGSTASVKGFGNCAHYVAAKTGLVGLTRTVANELGARSIRANVVFPTSVNTLMNQNDAMYQLFLPDVDGPDNAEFAAAMGGLHVLPTPWVEPIDVSNAVLFLASEQARFITGAELPVDAGFGIK